MDAKTIKTVLEAIENPTEQVKSALSDIEAFYNEASEIKSKYEGLQTQFSELETKSRTFEIDMMKEKRIREKAELKLDEYSKQIGEYNNKYKDYDALKSENENLKTYKEERDKSIRDDYAKRFGELSKKEAFSKVKNKVAVPSDEKKLEDFTIEEILASIKELDIAQEYGLFGSSGSQTSAGAGQAEQEQGDVMSMLDAAGIPHPVSKG